MKKCGHCGTRNDEWEANCVKCKEPFVPGIDPDRDAALVDAKADRIEGSRPTGQNAIGGGAICIVIGLVLIFAADSMSSAFFAGIGLINLGVIALVAGYIVSAIFWLPGKDDS